MKIFLDTNVLVSAFATRGTCADLLRYILVERELLVGEVVIVELRRALRERFKVPTGTLDDIEELLRERPVVPRPRRHLNLGLVDTDDEWVVASAVAAQAEVLVTGDAGLLEYRDPPLPIVNPRGLWELFRGARAGW